jgi:subtilase family serine protease
MRPLRRHAQALWFQLNRQFSQKREQAAMRQAQEVDQNANRRQFCGSTKATMLTFLATVIVAGSTMASAQGFKPLHVRSQNAEAITDANPAATAHFGCELRPFDLSKGLFCYGPAAIRSAYGVDQLIARGFTGKGQTIVIIDAFGSPTVEQDLAAFDAVFGLPAPPSITQIRMPGSAPFDNTDNNQLGWAEEVSLDVQWSHAIAPDAKIIVVAAVTNDDQDILDAQNFAINNRLGHVMSESFGELEIDETPALLAAKEESYKRAKERKITVFASAGDDGPTGTDGNGNIVPFASPQYPASSPEVTAVGGTNLFFGTATNADPNGTYQGEIVWNDGFGAGGGGISNVFRTPEFQEKLPKATRASLHGNRGYPDVSYNAGVVGGVIVHLGFFPANVLPPAFFIFGGTSAGAPQLAGFTSILNQLNEEPAGFLNDNLYKLGRDGVLNKVMHDITIGNNDDLGVTGFSATPGWDLATGWGTPAKGFLRALGSN